MIVLKHSHRSLLALQPQSTMVLTKSTVDYSPTHIGLLFQSNSNLFSVIIVPHGNPLHIVEKWLLRSSVYVRIFPIFILKSLDHLTPLDSQVYVQKFIMHHVNYVI
jgi:hypothetical protein